jgi:hypothetical protein
MRPLAPDRAVTPSQDANGSINSWFAEAFLLAECRPSVMPAVEMSFRNARDVPLNVRVPKNDGPFQNGR